jgi:hypothetical protein
VADWLMSQFPRFASCLKGYRTFGQNQAWAHCPNAAGHKHGDRDPSLALMLGRDGRLIISCRGKCEKRQVLAAVGLTFADIGPPDRRRRDDPVVEVAWYDYRDPDGEPAYQVVRFDPKRFEPRRRLHGDPKGPWVYGLLGGQYADRGRWGWRRVRAEENAAGAVDLPEVRWWPYNADLLAAYPDRPCLWVEGEGKADLLGRLGFLATTTQGGAKCRRWTPDFVDLFRHRVVLVLPDHNEVGLEYAAWVAGALMFSKAAAVAPVDLPGLKRDEDVKDWLFRLPRGEWQAKLLAEVARAGGFARRRLPDLLQFAAPLAEPPPETNPSGHREPAAV